MLFLNDIWQVVTKPCCNNRERSIAIGSSFSVRKNHRQASYAYQTSVLFKNHKIHLETSNKNIIGRTAKTKWL